MMSVWPPPPSPWPPPPPPGKGGFGCGCGHDEAMLRAHEDCRFEVCAFCGGWVPKSERAQVAERRVEAAALAAKREAEAAALQAVAEEHRRAGYAAADVAALRSAMPAG